MPSNPSQHKTVSKPAFDRLLARLAADREAAAHEYEMLRCRLVDFFDGRGAEWPEVLADETLDRMASKLEEAKSSTTHGPTPTEWPSACSWRPRSGAVVRKPPCGSFDGRRSSAPRFQRHHG